MTVIAFSNWYINKSSRSWWASALRHGNASLRPRPRRVSPLGRRVASVLSRFSSLLPSNFLSSCFYFCLCLFLLFYEIPSFSNFSSLILFFPFIYFFYVTLYTIIFLSFVFGAPTLQSPFILPSFHLYRKAQINPRINFFLCFLLRNWKKIRCVVVAQLLRVKAFLSGPIKHCVTSSS